MKQAVGEDQSNWHLTRASVHGWAAPDTGKGTTTKLIFTTKSKCYPVCSHINTQPNLQINPGEDENLPAPRVLPDERLPRDAERREEICSRGSLQMPGSRAMLACASLSRWKGSPSPRSEAARPGTVGHGPATAEQHQLSLKNGLVCARRAGEQHSFRGSSCCGSDRIADTAFAE